MEIHPAAEKQKLTLRTIDASESGEALVRLTSAKWRMGSQLVSG